MSRLIRSGDGVQVWPDECRDVPAADRTSYAEDAILDEVKKNRPSPTPTPEPTEATWGEPITVAALDDTLTVALANPRYDRPGVRDFPGAPDRGVLTLDMSVTTTTGIDPSLVGLVAVDDTHHNVAAPYPFDCEPLPAGATCAVHGYELQYSPEAGSNRLALTVILRHDVYDPQPLSVARWVWPAA